MRLFDKWEGVEVMLPYMQCCYLIWQYVVLLREREVVRGKVSSAIKEYSMCIF